MRKIFYFLTMLVYSLVAAAPSESSDPKLRQKLQRAMEDKVIVEVRIGNNESYHGKVIEIKEKEFLILNPLTGQTKQLPLSRVYRIQQLKPSRKTIESYLGKEQVITVELLDGSTVKGQVVTADSHTFTVRDLESKQEIRLPYDHLKTFDKEPAGQRIVRNAMIGVGVGLGATVILLVALISD
jgi:small nuclear ribonucleoprotein (snRNP)-like protein